MAEVFSSTKSCFANAVTKLARFAAMRRDNASLEMLPVEIKSSFGGAP